MTKQKNRVNLTLDDELFATLTELSELSGTPKATIINDFLVDIKPNLDLSIDLIKKLKANQMQMSDAKNVFNNLLADAGDLLANAHQDMNNALREINKE
jgi:predicted DNA-binding protein